MNIQGNSNIHQKNVSAVSLLRRLLVSDVAILPRGFDPALRCSFLQFSFTINGDNSRVYAALIQAYWFYSGALDLDIYRLFNVHREPLLGMPP